MRQILVVGFVCWFTTLFQQTTCDTFGPHFPDQYYVEYEYLLPYTLQIQGEELIYFVQVYYDLPNLRLRVDYNFGVNKYLTVDDTAYAIFPVDNENFCLIQSMTTNETEQSIANVHYLPDVDGWNFTGLTFIFQPTTGSYIREYQYVYQIVDKVNNYTIYTNEDGDVPVRTDMFGTSFIDGSHYDKYTQEFYEYSTYPLSDKDFEVPSECLNASTSLIVSDDNANGLMTRMRSMMTTPQPQMEHIVRNKKFIEEYNQKSKGSHTLKLNRFASWSDEDFKNIMLPRQQEDFDEDDLQESPYNIDFMDLLEDLELSIDDSEIADALDWRGKGPVGPVLDQADCGSCWAFGAAETMTAAWWMVTQSYVGMSEQQIMDCAWSYGNYGCDGGWPWWAIHYVIDAGGIAQTSDYFYRGINEVCNDKSTPFTAKFSGYSMVPSRNSTILKFAIQTFGPTAVCIDASPLTFRFHDKGVYTNPECGYKFDDLDHCVLVVGWGSENGTEYWILKNSWSPYWGDEGYIYVNMEHDCGITTTPTIAIPDTSQLPAQNSLPPLTHFLKKIDDDFDAIEVVAEM